MLRNIFDGIRVVLPTRSRRTIARIGRFFDDHTMPQMSIESSLRTLRDRGFNPMKAVDIGAYHGEWTHLFRSIYPRCRVLMIEANQKMTGILRGLCDASDGFVDCDVSLLGATDGLAVRFVEMESGSSVFEECSPYPREYTNRVQTSLDTLVQKHQAFDAPDFLKLDVQGYELEVLKGARNSLSSVELVLLEASLIPVNRGCPLVDEVILFMRDAGFHLLDFCSQIRRKDGALWQTDLLFLKQDSSLAPKAKLDKGNWA